MDMHTDIVRALDAIVQRDAEPTAKPKGRSKNRTDKKLVNQTFCTQGVLPLDALSVAVSGVGELGSKKITDAQTEVLLQLASPAAFGLGAQTLVDPAVRDTHEIAANLIHLAWQAPLQEELLAQMRQGLGLPANSRLSLHLHNMLLYGEGQFFKPHQDTEKLPGMVASLVLVLPSAHLGGDFLVKQKRNKQTFQSEHLKAKGLTWLAFYADCQHEVKPVLEGVRVTLAFNVVLEAASAQSITLPSDAPEHKALQAALTAHLQVPTDQSPQRLVYYLDHQYTEHGLRWGLLKGDDRLVAEALLQAAQTLGLNTYLALADIRETWTVEAEEYSYRSRRSKRYDDEDDEEGDDENEDVPSDQPEPADFIDGSQSLDFWVDSDNQIQPHGSLTVRTDDVCWGRETDEADLVESDYQGYMGNYGETLDYWYRRAAVVVWPKQAEIAMHFEQHFEAALKELVKLTDSQQAQLTFAVARPWLLRRADIGLFKSYAHLAVTLENPESATALMANFSLLDLTASQVTSIQHLHSNYGQDWLDKLLQVWGEQLAAKNGNAYSSYYANPSAWFIAKDLVALLAAFARTDIPKSWLQQLIATYGQHYQIKLNSFAKASQLTLHAAGADLREQLTRLLQAAWLYEADAMLKALVDAVLAQPRVLAPASLAKVLIDLDTCLIQTKTAPPSSLALLMQTVLRAVDAEVALGLRGEQDQSMQVGRLHCHCTICAPALAFLATTSQSELVLPMAEAKRDHVQTELTQQDMGLKFDTLRNGSPYKLVITKPRALFRNAKSQFEVLLKQQQALAHLKWFS